MRDLFAIAKFLVLL